MSETLEIQIPRLRMETVFPNNVPTIRRQRYAALVISGAATADGGLVTAILSDKLSVPINLPKTGSVLDRTIVLYQGMMPVEIDQLTLIGAALTAGSIVLILAGD